MTPSSRRSSIGVSILEVLIAVALAAAVATVVLDAMNANLRWSETGEAQDDLALGANSIIRAISADLNESGWLIPQASLTIAGSLPITVSGDRAERYYPFVARSTSGGSLSLASTDGFAYIRRSASLQVNPAALPVTLPRGNGEHGNPGKSSWAFPSEADYFYRSFYGPNQELLFVKAARRPSEWRAEPGRAPSGRIEPFPGSVTDWTSADKHAALDILYPSGWIESTPLSNVFTPREDTDSDGVPDSPYGRLMEAAAFDPTGATLSIFWESTHAPTYQPQFPMTTETSIDAIRDYQYAVVPSRLGHGRLVRAMKVAGSFATATTPPEIGDCIATGTSPSGHSFSMLVDRVLSDDVVRIVFDTYRTTSDDYLSPTATADVNEQLMINQVRARIYMAKTSSARGDRGTTLFRIIDTTFTMRARNSDELRLNDTTLLGPAGLVYPTR